MKSSLKNRIASSLASVLEFQAKLTYKKPIITRKRYSFVLNSYKIPFDNAMAEFNYKITPIEKARGKTISWFKLCNKLSTGSKINQILFN